MKENYYDGHAAVCFVDLIEFVAADDGQIMQLMKERTYYETITLVPSM
jgi:hypothetical protein